MATFSVIVKDGEIVRPIPGFLRVDGCKGYFASNLGRIFSANGVPFKGILKELNPSPAGSRGVPWIKLYKNGDVYPHYVSNLIAAAFLPPKPGPEYQVDHISNDFRDNRAVNLQWLTPGENIRKSQAAFDTDDLKAICEAYAAGETYASIAAKYGVGPATVSNAVRGKTYADVRWGEAA